MAFTTFDPKKSSKSHQSHQKVIKVLRNMVLPMISYKSARTRRFQIFKVVQNRLAHLPVLISALGERFGELHCSLKMKSWFFEPTRTNSKNQRSKNQQLRGWLVLCWSQQPNGCLYMNLSTSFLTSRWSNSFKTCQWVVDTQRSGSGCWFFEPASEHQLRRSVSSLN